MIGSRLGLQVSLLCLVTACGDAGSGTASATGSTGTTTGTTAGTTAATTGGTPTTGTSAGTATGTEGVTSAPTTSGPATTTATSATTGEPATGTTGTSEPGTTSGTTSGTSGTSGTTEMTTDAGTMSGSTTSTSGAVDPPPPPEMPAGCGFCDCCDPWPISWAAVPEATHYVVRWKCSINPEQVHDVGAVTKIADVCIDIDMCNGMCAFTVGYIRVQACNEDGCSAPIDIPADEIPLTCGGDCCC